MSRYLPLLSAIAAISCLCQPSTAIAFHERGVANCDGCHVMHDSQDGFPLGFGDVGALLKGPSASDVCLSCHATELGAVLADDPLFPSPEMGGGNFVFLFEDNLNDGPEGATNPIPGEAAGHSIVAPGYGLATDSRHPLSPGGSFPASELGCTSCHDPHGNASFRMLHGEGSVAPGTPPFTRPAPTAEGLDLLTGSESNSNHTAYQAGMSEWCANCHGRYHDQSGNFFDHPVDENLETEVVTQYNQYNGDDDPIGGFQATAYLAAVPFEDTTNTITSTFGPSAGSQLMCLTCHRAHASSALAAGRWDFNVTLLQEDGLASGSYPIPDPYLSPNQGTLCAKCHEGGPPS